MMVPKFFEIYLSNHHQKNLIKHPANLSILSYFWYSQGLLAGPPPDKVLRQHPAGAYEYITLNQPDHIACSSHCTALHFWHSQGLLADAMPDTDGFLLRQRPGGLYTDTTIRLHASNPFPQQNVVLGEPKVLPAAQSISQVTQLT